MTGNGNGAEPIGQRLGLVAGSLAAAALLMGGCLMADGGEDDVVADGINHLTTFGEDTVEVPGELEPIPLPRREICDCRDNNGNGLIDENLDCEYEVTMDMAADDAFTAFFDGAVWGSGTSWQMQHSLSVATSHGTHHIAVAAMDTAGSVAG
ncbi:MAG: hypothetical protein AAGC55_20995, partial [Myxococcota bacterium]